MCRRSFLFSLGFLLAAVLLLSALSASIAQDGTISPTVSPLLETETSPEPLPQVIRLPFSDTFDSIQTWTPNGEWRFINDDAYDGGGWHVDGFQRNEVSTLEYSAMIDLTGTLSAQLIYRQKGLLPTSDLVAVDLSLNGGQSWFLVDDQIGVDSDWDLHVIDLTDYRSQVIRLRFRVSTGNTILDAAKTGMGYWIDNLTIQFVMLPPENAFAPIDIGPRTLMGLHLIVGAQKEPVIALATRLREIGWPLGTLKGTSGTEEILNAVARISPETIIVFRSLLTPFGQTDCPSATAPPSVEARDWMAGLQSYWAGIEADYFEIINECQLPIEWLVEFSIEAMRIANSQGQCLLLFSFGPGNPEIDQFAHLLPVYEYALQNPCQPGRYHGIALHAYGVEKSTLLSDSGIYLGLRHRMFYAQILPTLPEAIQIPVYLTEAGAGDGRSPFRCEDITRDVIQYTRQIEFDPYIRGFHLWTLGAKGEWINLTPCLDMIGDALENYYRGR
jgi:hypothetical protein